MTEYDTHKTEKLAELRARAESIQAERPTHEIPSIALEDAHRLIEELQVHQIELELQNDELRKIQERFAAERERYADLYNFAPVAYFTFDERDLIVDMNLAAAEMLGHERKFLVDRPLTPYLTSESLQTFVESRNQALQNGRPHVCELTLRPRKNIQPISVQARTVALPLHPEQDRQLWRTVMTDVTDRKNAEETLRHQAYLIANIRDAIIATDTDLRITQWNAAAEALYDWREEEVIGRNIDEVCATQFIGVSQEEAQAQLAIHKIWRGELQQQRRNGEKIWVSSSVSLLENANGISTGGIAINTDVTEIKKAENILKARLRITEFANENTLAATLQNALDELCALSDSPIGFFHFVEPDQKTLSLQAWSTRTLNEMCTAEGRGRHYDVDQAGVWVDCVRDKKPVIHNNYAALPHRKGLPAGHAPIIREMVFPIIRGQKIQAIIGVGNKPIDYTPEDLDYASRLADLIWDITERKRADEQVRKLSRAVEQSQVSVIITNALGNIEYVNPKFSEVTGYAPEEALGKNPRILKAASRPPEEYENLWKSISSGREWRGEFLNSKKSGEHFWEATIISPIINERGEITHFVAVKEDITDRKNAEENLRSYVREIEALHEQLREQAIRDPITGLFNRRYMQETLDREIARAQRSGEPVGIFIMDIDRFKQVNDTYGHKAGDLVLQKVSELIIGNLRADDVPCRYGGEEFLVIIPGAALDVTLERAQLIWEKIGAMRVNYEESEIKVTVSVGVAAFPLHAATGDETLIRADYALYHAKDSGRNKVIVYHEGISPRKANLSTLSKRAGVNSA